MFFFPTIPTNYQEMIIDPRHVSTTSLPATQFEKVRKRWRGWEGRSDGRSQF
jgi:hypothetical protein